jgi:hypothetical protein
LESALARQNGGVWVSVNVKLFRIHTNLQRGQKLRFVLTSCLAGRQVWCFLVKQKAQEENQVKYFLAHKHQKSPQANHCRLLMFQYHKI